ncbi:MaoC family dehydratase N-terminal domain-containing protein [Aeromicrobium sp. Leaf350]|uniref:FAS1-like dehydratase domain-containing protein n=1 Tax=Aeromicrobium sp. Leaf350 TaxID=2876565 RepID=UPI001E2DB742|nr:MaoC family dehydratase N-terminal domain-containing protein [Aeromicrobium sp. Leaf350]
MDEQVVGDRIGADQALALAGLLGREVAPVEGDALPLLWHFAYFLPRPAQHELAPDGHVNVGFPTPPRAGLRRMFAGGRVRLERGLRVGDEAVARTAVASSTEKQGRHGPMTLVTTRTTTSVGDDVALVDDRDIVYLESAPAGGAAAGASSTPVEPTGDAVRSVDVDPTLLFRYSALTYNAHRIHYDREYARDVEGHPGLVVHGPLQAVLMAELATGLEPDASTFAYRLTSPLHEGRGLHVVADRIDGGVEVRVQDDAGVVTARATWT